MEVKIFGYSKCIDNNNIFCSFSDGKRYDMEFKCKGLFLFPVIFVYICFRTCVVAGQFNMYRYVDEIVREITKNIGNERPAHPLTRYCYVIAVLAIGAIYWDMCNHIPVESRLIHNLLGIDILIILLASMVLLVTSVKYECDVYESLRRTSIVTPILGIIAALIEIVIVLGWYIGY